MAHRSPITCVDHHSGALGLGSLIVTGGYDGRVVGWRNGVEVWEESFDDLVNDVRIDPSGTRVAVAAADRHTFILDAATGARVDMLGPHGDDVNAVRWSPDGAQLVCVMDHLDTAVRVWERAVVDTVEGRDATRGRWHDRRLVGHDSGVFAAAFDPTGRYLATVAEDSTGRIWSLETGELVHVLEHPGDPEALDWSPDGSVVVTGCDDGIARVWNPTTGELIRELTDANAAVRFLRFDATGRRLLAGAYDATMRLYDCVTWTVTNSFHGAFQWERASCFTTDGIVIGGFSAAPFVLPRHEAQPVPLTYGINALCVVGPGAPMVIVGRDDGAVVDVDSGTVLSRHETIVNTVAVSPDRTLVASADYRGVVHLTALAGLDAGRVISASADGGGPINSVVWHPTGQQLFTGGYDGVARRWVLADGADRADSADGADGADGAVSSLECVEQWVAHHGPIKSLAWAVKPGVLVAGSSDGSLTGWAWRGRAVNGGIGVEPEVEQTTVNGPTELWRSSTDDLVLVNAVAVAESEGTVVTASRDLRVRRWDVTTGALLETLPRGHHKSVKAIAVSADGSTIVTGSYDGNGIVWWRQADRSWAWRPLRHHGKPGVPAVGLVDDVCFTGGWDGTVARWNLRGDLLSVHQANQIA